ncbi:UbiA family prenyltransferase [Halococcus hamelinensis]|uniref:UbiA family prenyltransferase n=1 Tax=Halococcus hamelinensis TaxID=332168 RepID=UPI000AC447C9|nr:UbiA family prenyltransferase [Halococcus hamelinensis]
MARGDLRDRFEAYASLVRLPNLFSAPPDVMLGAALVAASGGAVSIPALAGLAVASVLLYAGGTTLNDYFDAPVDSRERPERPIPSGRVPRSRAGALGGGLLVAGVLVGFLAAGPRAGLVAAALAGVVLAYDGWLKGTGVGFLAMGVARGLDVVLGFAAGGFRLPTWVVFVPLVVVVYIALVTRMAANEATTTERGVVAGAAGGVVLGGAAVFALVGVVRPPLVETLLAVALVAGFFAWTGRAIGEAYATPRPDTVGPAVGTCVLALVVLDAAFAAVAGVPWALVAFAFLVPAVGFSRLFDVS